MNALTTSKPIRSTAPLQNIHYQFKNTSAYCYTNFFENICTSLKSNSEKKLLTWQNGYSTGKILHARISGIRNELIQHCISAADEIMIIAPVGEELIASILATMALGAIPVLPAQGMLPQDLLRQIRSRRIKTVLSSQAPLLVKIISNFGYLNIIETGKIKSCDLDFPIRLVNHHQGALVSINESKEPKTDYQSHKSLLEESEELVVKSGSDVDLTSRIKFILYSLCKGKSSIFS